MLISIDLKGKTAVVVGGGKVAARKSLSLIRSGADVLVIAPALGSSLERLVRHGYLSHLAKKFSSGDLDCAAIAFAATDDPEVNRLVASEAAASGIPVNVADSPGLSSFSSPAAIRRGDFTISVTTGGKAPAFSRMIRKRLALSFGREYGETVALMGKIREKLLTQNDNRRYNKRILSELANSDLQELLASGSFTELDNLLLALCGPGNSMAELGMRKETNQ